MKRVALVVALVSAHPATRPAPFFFPGPVEVTADSYLEEVDAIARRPGW